MLAKAKEEPKLNPPDELLMELQAAHHWRVTIDVWRSKDLESRAQMFACYLHSSQREAYLSELAFQEGKEGTKKKGKDTFDTIQQMMH